MLYLSACDMMLLTTMCSNSLQQIQVKEKIYNFLGYTLDLTCKQEQHGQFSNLMGQHLIQEIFEKL
jgi:hypothetical protein